MESPAPLSHIPLYRTLSPTTVFSGDDSKVTGLSVEDWCVALTKGLSEWQVASGTLS